MSIPATASKTVPRIRKRTYLTTKRSIIALYVALSVLYLGLTLLLPPDKKTIAKYQLSTTSIKIVSLVIYLPLIAIWGVSFYGYYHYNRYAASIKKSKDGVFHRSVAIGLFLLALTLPLSSIINNILTYYGRQRPGFLPSSVIIGNYVGLVLYLLAFYFIYKGANGLLRITDKSLRTRGEVYLMMLYTLIVGMFFYLSLHNPARQFPTSTSTTAAYFLPDWLIVTTMLIPYAVVWYWGVMSAYRLWLYRNNVKGSIYRSAFTRLAVGLAVVVALIMTLRYLLALTTLLNKLALNYVLLMIFVLLIFIAIGYMLIAIGAKRLKKIEDV